MPYEDYLPKSAPPWLQRQWGKAYLGSVGRRLDGVVALYNEAVFARLPGLAAEDALTLIGLERGLPRGPAETVDAYRQRLIDAWDAYAGDNRPLVGVGGGAGSFLGMLLALKAGGFPTGATGATIITHGGRYAQLDGGGALVLGQGPICVNRPNLLGAVPGTLLGFTLDARGQFYSKFGITFPSDFPELRPGTTWAAAINAIADRWRPSKAYYVGAFVIEVGGGWDWPTTQTWDDGSTWDSDTVHFIPPPF